MRRCTWGALVLGLALLVSPATAKDDLLKVDAKGPVKMSAEKVTFDERTSSYLAEGDVVITRGDVKLKADQVRLFSETLVAEAEGNAVLSGRDQEVQGARLIIDLKGETGKIYKGTIFIRANHFYLRGDEIEKTGLDTYRMTRGSFTSCDGPKPAWSIAGEEMQITVEGYGTVKSNTFRIKDVPVVWAPYMVFPVKFQRQSGLLTPMAGYSNRDGFVFSLPYFQTLGEWADATITLNFMTLRGFDLGVEFRYALTPDSKGVLQFDYLFDDWKGQRLFDDGTNAAAYNERYWLRGMADQAMGPWTMRIDLDIVSDQDYLREFTFGHTGFNNTNERFLEWFSRTLDPETSLTRTSRLNLTRSWAAWTINAGIIYYDNTATDNQRTLQTLPTISLDGLRQEIANSDIYFQLNSTYTNYYRPEGSTGHIFDITPAIMYPFNMGNYLEVEPKVTLSARAYSVTLAENESDADGLDTSGFSDRWRFDLATSSYLYRVFQIGDGPKGMLVKHAVRPYADYVYQPELDEDGVASLARRTSTTVNRISYGLRNVFTSKTFPARKTKKGDDPEPVYRDFLRINLAHSFDIEESRRGTMFNEYDVTNDDGTTTVVTEEIEKRPWGNIDLRIEFDPNRYIYWQTDMSFDPYDTIFSSFNSLLRLSDKRGDSIILDYRYGDGGINQLDTELRIMLTSEWALSYINRTDFEENTQIENTIQVSYTGQCWGMRVFYTNDTREQGLYVAFSLAGLGEVFGLGSGVSDTSRLSTTMVGH